ncbi:MAG: hypothetical protein KDD58_01255 [Bdellovibrionales bacterium]|nr:hypothetical protein [Bdellovibrionales bacterium]
MKLKAILISLSFVTALSIFPLRVFAHGAHDHHHHHDTSECNGHCSSTGSDSKLKTLAHLIHESITGEHIHTHTFKDFLISLTERQTWALWLRGLQSLPSAPVNYQRAINLSAHEENNMELYAQHAKNIFLLYGMGEVIEVLVVPALGTTFAFESDSSPLIRSVVGGFSYLTAIPGVEPVCGLLMACYFLSPKLQRGMSWTVNSAYNLTYSTYSFFTGTQLTEYSPLAMSESIISSLSPGDRFQVLVHASQGLFQVKIKIANSDPTSLLELNFHVEEFESPLGYEVEAYLEKLVIDPIYLSDPQFVKLARSLAAIYGKNVHSAVKEGIQMLQRGNHNYVRRFYVREVQQILDQVTINYRPNAIFVKKMNHQNVEKWKRAQIKKCEGLLSRKL